MYNLKLVHFRGIRTEHVEIAEHDERWLIERPNLRVRPAALSDGCPLRKLSWVFGYDGRFTCDDDRRIRFFAFARGRGLSY